MLIYGRNQHAIVIIIQLKINKLRKKEHMRKQPFLRILNSLLNNLPERFKLICGIGNHTTATNDALSPLVFKSQMENQSLPLTDFEKIR